ncbi:hypothetical protein ACNOYE_26975 [Nannocystaceae bacterium ST9]
MNIEYRDCRAQGIRALQKVGLFALLLVGCEPPSPTGEDEIGGDTTEGLDDGTSGSGDCLHERIVLDPEIEGTTRVSVSKILADDIGFDARDQVRIERSGGDSYALYTVDDLDAEVGEIRMNEDAMARLGVVDGECARLVTYIAPMPPEFVETLNPGSTKIAVLCPHGGEIDLRTDDFAEVLVGEIESRAQIEPTLWMAEADHEGPGTHKIWHIPSEEISANSFPEFDLFDDDDYEWTVAIHGFAATGEPGDDSCVATLQEALPDISANLDFENLVIVGGLAEDTSLLAVGAAVNAVLGSAVEVLVLTSKLPTDGISCAGKDPNNVVNRVAALDDLGRRRSVQIELGEAVREDPAIGNLVMAAVAEALAGMM